MNMNEKLSMRDPIACSYFVIPVVNPRHLARLVPHTVASLASATIYLSLLIDRLGFPNSNRGLAYSFYYLTVSLEPPQLGSKELLAAFTASESGSLTLFVFCPSNLCSVTSSWSRL